MDYKLIDKRKKTYIRDLEPSDLFIFKEAPDDVYMLIKYIQNKFVLNISNGVLLHVDNYSDKEIERVGYELKIYRQGE